ncbi:MAG: serine hydrolase [Chloroflexota bacterium]|nr:serine hydrolase [Chloroflexota bacterium]
MAVSFLLTACLSPLDLESIPTVEVQLSASVIEQTPISTPEPTPIYPGAEWQWVESAEALGWDTEKLARAKAYAEKIGSAAVMIIDNGIVVDGWGDLTREFKCHSMRKSLLSALYGIYVADGKIDITMTLAELGIDDKTPLTEVEKQATVADLLKARSGIYIPAAGEAASMRADRPERGSHPPGTFWYYNNWDFNALGSIFDQLSGEKDIYDAFDERIAQPIGMQQLRATHNRYDYVSYSQHPYYGFRMSTEDLARFGLLFLRDGRWNDEQIVPAEWLAESTTSYSEIGPNSGYGYMWWTGEGTGLFPTVDVGGHSYRASGYSGQELIILPEHDLVVAHRVDTYAGDRVGEQHIGVLLWMILDAAGKQAGPKPPVVDLATGERLAGKKLENALIDGKLWVTADDNTIDIIISPEGDITLKSSGQIVDSGHWRVDGGNFCLILESFQGVEQCGVVIHDGELMKFYGSDGFLSLEAFYDNPVTR